MTYKLTRRKFIKNAAITGTGIAVGAPLLSSCITPGEVTSSSTIESGPVHYPRLPGQKIQSPEHYGLKGCMTGCWYGWISPNQSIAMWTKMTGKEPTVLFLPYRESTLSKGEFFSLPPEIKKVMFMHTITDDMIATAERGVIPFVTYDMSESINNRSKKVINRVNSGEFDKAIIGAAKIFKQYGEQYGGFFIRTMREMNMQTRQGWTPWGGSPSKFIKAWKHIWQIFEDEGANEYATWVWSPYSSNNKTTSRMEAYYPGENYVDWIGFNGYNFEGQGLHARKTFSELFKRDHNKLLKRKKPMMVQTVGTSENRYKPKWVKDAHQKIKNNLKGFKGLFWWHDKWSHLSIRNYDSRVNSSPSALNAIRVAMSDPYFLGKVPYRIG